VDYTLLIRTNPEIHAVEMIAEILSHLKGVEVVEILEGHGAAPGMPYEEPGA